MKKRNYLKGLRVLLAILFFVPILLFFVDFSGVLPDSVHRLLHLQLMPALLGGTVGLIVFQFLLALVFGRIYCSTICPAGVFQDIINRLFCIGKKKKKGSRRFTYHKPMNRLRYVLLVITAVMAVFGLSELCLLLDPYSNFGRIAASLFRPIVMWGNNLLADLLMKVDNYSLFHVTISTVTASGLIAATIALLVFIVMTVFRGRLFCNTICPVGALLSLFSRYSFFRITFDKEACTHCGNCEHTCKAEAIDSKNLTIDTSRCVDCFNCVSSCAKGGLRYRLQFPGMKQEETVDTQAVKELYSSQLTVANSRRTFLATSATIAASLPIASAIARRRKRENEQKRQKEVASPHASGFYQSGTFQRQMYRMPDMCRPLSEPGLAPDRIGIRFGLYVETTSGLYQQLLQLRVHSLFRCMPYRCDQTSDYRREDNDTGRHCHFLQRPLCC